MAASQRLRCDRATPIVAAVRHCVPRLMSLRRTASSSLIRLAVGRLEPLEVDAGAGILLEERRQPLGRTREVDHVGVRKRVRRVRLFLCCLSMAIVVAEFVGLRRPAVSPYIDRLSPSFV